MDVEWSRYISAEHIEKARSHSIFMYEGANISSATSLLSALARSSACGVCLYAGASVASAAMSGKLLRKPMEVADVVALKGCLRFGAFVGGFTGLYRVISKCLRHWRQQEDGLNALIAAAVAGCVIKLQPRERRTSLLLLISTRGFGALLSTLHMQGLLPSIRGASLIVYCASVGTIIHSTVLCPENLPQNYYRSLLRWTGCLTDSHLKVLFRPKADMTQRPTCAELYHPHCTCLENVVPYFFQCWKCSSILYGILYTVPLLLLRTKTLAKRPFHVLLSMVVRSLQSGAFLAAASSVCITSFCWMSNTMQARAALDPATWKDGMPHLLAFLTGFLAGLPLLIERPSRRFELLLYVLPIVVHIIVKHLQRSQIFPPLRHASIFVFGASMMSIMHAYEFHRESLPPFVYRFLSFLIH